MIDGSVPGGSDSHAALLKQMAEPRVSGSGRQGRSSVIDQALSERLHAYLEFRHLFRHAYTFDLQWERMEPLVSDLEGTAAEFERQVAAFMSSLP